MREFRDAFRSLRRAPAYALTVVIVLALGIGANIISFNFYSSVALTPVPGVERSADLVMIGARTQRDQVERLSWHDFEYLRARLRSYEAVAGTTLASFTLGRGSQAIRIYGEMVTGDYFETLGVRAQIGRVLSPADNRTPRAHPLVVISDRLWRRHYAADPAIVGRTVVLGAAAMTVVGVAEPTFHGTVVGLEIEAFVPTMMQPVLSGGWDAVSTPEAQLLYGVARPRNGVSLADARREAAVVGASLAGERHDDQLTDRAVVMPITESPQGLQNYASPLVRVMAGTSALLLVSVCANVAGLVMVRCVARRSEFAARLALGAGRLRVMRLVVVENLLLAVPGMLVGLWLPSVVGGYLLDTQLDRSTIPIRIDATADSLALVAILVAVAAALGCALWPALQSARLDVIGVMRDDASNAASRSARFRTVLVGAQIAAALVLLVGMTLSLRSFEAARRADPGFDTDDVATAVLDLNAAGYQGLDGMTYYARLLDDLRRQPGVERASLMNHPLLMLWDFGGLEFDIEGRPASPGENRRLPYNVVSADHFVTLRIRQLAGRDFRADDVAGSEPVAIVNETMARRFWGSPEAALGRRIKSPGWRAGRPEWRRIVGVVADVKYARLNEAPTPYVYMAVSQTYLPLVHVHVRSRHDPARAFALLRDRVHATDPNVSIVETRMLGDQTRLGFAIYDVAARVLGFIGLVAMALATVGIYGLVAYSVRLRLREIGIRMAIGEPRLGIMRRYLLMGARVGLAGTAAGVLTSFVAVRLMSSLLFGVSSSDAWSLGIATLSVITLTIAAAAVPAWRASRMHPSSVLRVG
jgi:macrolide transport system ATP-binding/permease protein